MIRGANCEFNSLKSVDARRGICAVDMTEIARGDPVFLENAYDLSADESAPDGRKVQKDEDGKIPSVRLTELYRLVKAHSQTDDLAVDDARIVNGSHGVLLPLLHEPPTCSANDAILDKIGVIVEHF